MCAVVSVVKTCALPSWCGAILYPGQRLPDDRADIVVVLNGPVRPISLREKRRVACIWLNADSIRLRTSPGFYAIGSSRPIGDIVDERTAAIFELGLSNLSMSPTGFSEAKTLERFENGRSEEHTSERQSLMRSSYAAFCLITKTI